MKKILIYSTDSYFARKLIAFLYGKGYKIQLISEDKLDFQNGVMCFRPESLETVVKEDPKPFDAFIYLNLENIFVKGHAPTPSQLELKKILSLLKAKNISVHNYIFSSNRNYGDPQLVKKSADELQALIKEYSLKKKSLIIAPGIIIGAQSELILNLRKLAQLGLARALKKRKAEFSWIHWKDAAGAFVLAIESGWTGEIDLTNRFSTSVEKLVEAYQEVGKRGSKKLIPSFLLGIISPRMRNFLAINKHAVPTELNRRKFYYEYATIELAMKEIGAHL